VVDGDILKYWANSSGWTELRYFITLLFMERRRFHRGGRGQFGKRPIAKPKDPPLLLGEPSPSLAKINTMNMVKLEAKIAELVTEQTALNKRIARLEALDQRPDEQLERTGQQLERLKVLEKAARERLAGKSERRAIWEQKQQGLSSSS
tara:strand:+ start:2283 stop:2729 length:447 start_codon:yes stop_codon:yes gene_type:complete